MPAPAPIQSLADRFPRLLAPGVPWHKQRLLRGALAAIAAYSLVGFLLVPACLRHFLPGAIGDALGVEASIGGASFNPFSLRLELRGIALAEPGGTPLGAVEQMVVDLQASSLFRRAWTFSEISLGQPVLDIVLEKDGRLNLARVAAALPPAQPDADPDAAPPRLLVHRLGMSGARVVFIDETGAAPARTAFGPSELQVLRLSTLPEDRGSGTLAVELAGGARVSWNGELGLHPLASSGTLQIEGLKPEAFHDFLRHRVSLDPVGGVLALSLAYQLGMPGGEFALSTRDMRLDLRDLRLRQPGAARDLLSLGVFTVEDGSFDLAGNRLRLGRVGVTGGVFSASIDAANVLDWETLMPPAPTAPAAPAPAPGSPSPWDVEVASLTITDLGIDLMDHTRNAPLGLSLRLRQAGFALRSGADAGEASPLITLSGAALEAGEVALTTGAERTTLGTIARIALRGAEVELAAERLGAESLVIEGLQTALHRERDGNLREIRLASAPDPVTPLPVTHAAAAWKLRLGEFRLTGLDASLEDAATGIAVAVKGGKLGVKDVDTSGSAPLRLDAELPVEQGGRIGISGTASADGRAADVSLSIATLALSPLAPLVAQDTTLLLDAGTVSTQLDIGYRSAGADPMALRVSGGASVDGLRLREADSGGHFLAWSALEAAGLDFSLGPDRLGITELRLKGADAKVVVQKDRSVNLAAVMRETSVAPEAADAAPALASVAPAAVAPPGPVSEAASAPEAFPVIIDRIRVENSVVDFADYSLVLPFAARIEGLKGVAKGISSDANGRATLAFSGRVGEYGEADIDGQLAPFDPTHFTDIEIAFRNIALTPLSPYSATFAGRTIKAGDLDLSLQYKVDNQKLLGKNEVVLQNFKLGESVKSKDAVSLPLDLAIALLSDSKGRIDLAVPVSGDVGDPKFSYGHLIWKAIGNLITGVVTAPFRALGSLFGGGEEQVQAIRFKSGSAELMPMERQRIAKVATALSQRPRLAVRVPAATHAERDGYALRRVELRRLHAAEMGYELAAGEDPGPVSYSNGRSQRALEKLLAVRGGDDAADRFAASWAKKQGREPERVNAALALVGRGSPDHEFYRAMYLELVNTTPEPPGGMLALAAARAEAISAELRTRGVEAARVSIGEAAPMQKAKPSGVMLPLELLAAG